MIFTWLRNRRRKKILAAPMPGHWESILNQNVSQLARLTPPQRSLLYQRVQIFVKEKYWEGCNGFEITEEVKLTIAGQACLITLGFASDCFDRLKTVLVYPETYAAKETLVNSIGVMTEGTSFRLGESWGQGPIILSWESIREGGEIPDDGRNVVIHEFAHYYDAVDHQFDGTPPLNGPEEYERWNEVMTAEYQSLVSQLRHGHETFIDPYGATNPAEFFAVCSEHFFEQPHQMQEYSVDLYETLRMFYRQDPAQAV
ncbi:M90 family metallopeptidase [uncultured Gimesia sp.]|uniref:M90 family metallopeptidase n=1 Tax=uncultured Gimesia sp. TaxID=1678688 RepID=UPI0030D8ECB5|tara:strand:- start:7925 stop:8695 length:771 start_codon:yes stop_codon:yes gene_type:complete